MRMGKNDNLAPLKKRTGAVTFFAQDIAGGDSRENVKKLFSLSFSPSAQFLAEKRPPPFCLWRSPDHGMVSVVVVVVVVIVVVVLLVGATFVLSDLCKIQKNL